MVKRTASKATVSDNISNLTIDPLCRESKQVKKDLERTAESEKQAKENQRLEQLKRKALLGWAKMNIINGPITLQFGHYNFRELNKKEGKLLHKSMIENGIRRYQPEHAIPIVAPKQFVKEVSLLKNAVGVSSIKEIEWTAAAREKGYVIAAGGRHRQYAAEIYHDNVIQATDSLQASIDKKTPESPGYSEIKMELENMLVAKQDCQWWLVAVYDESTSYS